MLCTAWNHHYVMTVRVMNNAQVDDFPHVPDRCPLLTWHTMQFPFQIFYVCANGGGGREEMGLIFSTTIPTSMYCGWHNVTIHIIYIQDMYS